MQQDLDPNLDIRIPIHPLLELFECPICFNSITDCYMTLCGHNFCHDCIDEAVNRRHTCPCCNQPVEASQLIKNHQFDQLGHIINVEKSKILGLLGEGVTEGTPKPGPTELAPPNPPTTTTTSTADGERVRLVIVITQLGDLRIEGISLSPATPVWHLRRCVSQHFSEARRERVAAWTASNLFSLVREGGDQVILHDPLRPLSAYSIADGATLSLAGRLAFEPADVPTPDASLVEPAPLPAPPTGPDADSEDAPPPECFVTAFRRGAGMRQDYFTCKTCGINWICASCASHCHRGHELTPFMFNHLPTWACCYCHKKNRACQLK